MKNTKTYQDQPVAYFSQLKWFNQCELQIQEKDSFSAITNVKITIEH
jgi:hypothetical protein